MRHQRESGDPIPQLTRLEILERGDGRWSVPQPGVDVVGEGPSAARAAEDYCAKVADRGENEEADV